MSNDEIYIKPPPALCDDCGKRVIRTMLEKPDRTQIAQFCPHSESLAFATVGEIDGHRAITGWQMCTCLSEAQAVQIIQGSGDLAGANFTLEAGSERIN